MFWFLYYTLCDVDTLDQLTRHCNWDPTAETTKTSKKGAELTKTRGCYLREAKSEEEGLTYKQLQDLCPSVLNEKAEANLFRTMVNIEKMRKKRAKTPANRREEIYKKELLGFEEPLRSLIHKFREWVRMQGGRKRKRDEEADSDYFETDDPDIVQLTHGEPKTFHAYRRANMFVEGEFGAALQTDLEKSFTAVHVHLPKNLGEDGNLEDFETKLTTLMENIINTTTQEGIAVKVHIHFVSWHVNCISVFGSEN